MNKRVFNTYEKGKQKIFMENWNLYVDLGCGIPQYAAMEILRAMRDEAKPAENSLFGFCVQCEDGFGVGQNAELGMCLLANRRCVGLEVTSLYIEPDAPNGTIIVYFSKR